MLTIVPADAAARVHVPRAGRHLHAQPAALGAGRRAAGRGK